MEKSSSFCPGGILNAKCKTCWFQEHSHITDATVCNLYCRSWASYSPIPIQATSPLDPEIHSACAHGQRRIQNITSNWKLLKFYSDILSAGPSISFSFSLEVKALEWPTQCPHRHFWNLFSVSDHSRAAWTLGDFALTPIHPALSLDHLEIQLFAFERVL